MLHLRVYRYRDIRTAVGQHFRYARQCGLKTVVLDDGGYVLPEVLRTASHALPDIVGVVEQTISGINKIRDLAHAVPIFTVAESQVKATVESYGIADASVRNTLSLLPNEKFEGQAAVVTGFGRIGRQIASVLRSRRMRVGVYDVSVAKLVAAHEEGFVTAADLERLLRQHAPLLVVGTTGTCSMTAGHLDALVGDTYLVSATSRDYEFDLPAFERCASSCRRLGRLGTRYYFPGDRTVTVLGHGFPINFHYAESLPNKYVDLVLASMIAGGAELISDATRFRVPGNKQATDAVLGASQLLTDYYRLYGPPDEPEVPGDHHGSRGGRMAAWDS